MVFLIPTKNKSLTPPCFLVQTLFGGYVFTLFGGVKIEAFFAWGWHFVNVRGGDYRFFHYFISEPPPNHSVPITVGVIGWTPVLAYKVTPNMSERLPIWGW